MTTRSGRVYQVMDEIGGEVGDSNQEVESEGTACEPISEMMRFFIEDRRRRDEELAEERRRWLEEKRAWEVAAEEERQRRDEEMRSREEYNRRQVELLQSLVQGVQLQGEAAVKRADNDKDVRVQKLTENDDIVAYLTTFERLMKAYEVKEERLLS